MYDAKGIIETLNGHECDPQLGLDLFGEPGRSSTDQVLKAREYRDKWLSRMILGRATIPQSHPAGATLHACEWSCFQDSRLVVSHDRA